MVSLICFGQNLFEFMVDRGPPLANEKRSAEAVVGHQIFTCMLATILGASAKHVAQNAIREKKDTKVICELQTISLAQRRESESQTRNGSQKIDERSPVNRARRVAGTVTYRNP